MVIVTTAVYWGLNSQLRQKGLTNPLNLPAPGRSQSVYIVLRLRTDLCFDKQSLPPGLCDPYTLQAASAHHAQGPLLPKLRGAFCRVLNHDSLDRLSILYLITCVGLGYGRLKPHADAFLGSIGSPNPQKTGSHHVSGTQPAHLTTDNPTRLDHDNHRVVGYLPASHLLTRLPPKIGPPTHTTHKQSLHIMLRMVSITISVWAVFHRYGNINPLSIDYACRPRLRPRLTQGRLT